MCWWKNDDAVDAHYARNYYGPGTDYFNPPDWDEDEEPEDDYEEDLWDDPEYAMEHTPEEEDIPWDELDKLFEDKGAPCEAGEIELPEVEE